MYMYICIHRLGASTDSPELTHYAACTQNHRLLSSPGTSDSHLYLGVLAEVVTTAGLTPFFSTSKSAAISGQTVSKELHLQTFCPAQQGHPVALRLEVQLAGRACQLCTLPFGHS
ncbi:TPA: hypothetical protein ACH3X1_014359 [Trebouxia sp. C0004]